MRKGTCHATDENINQHNYGNSVGVPQKLTENDHIVSLMDTYEEK